VFGDYELLTDWLNRPVNDFLTTTSYRRVEVVGEGEMVADGAEVVVQAHLGMS